MKLNTFKKTTAILLVTSLFTSMYSMAGTTSSEVTKKPNILFLLADDLGYGELGSYGQDKIKTPNIDELARHGKKFTQFYAGNAVCSPSRAVLMTGKHSGHATIRGNKGHHPNNVWDRVSLRKDELTLGEMLQQADYQTAFVGKWHLENANDLETWAFARGFDYSVQEQWKMDNSKIEFDERMHWVNGINQRTLYDYTKWDNLDEFRTNFAMEYLETIKTPDKPFFLFMSYRAPHGHEKLIRNKSLYKDKGWPASERHHAAKITLWDKQVGRIINYLKETGEYENTLIVLTSDNGGHNEGGHDYRFFKSNGELRGYKRDLYEGGIRVPNIVVWPGKVAKNSVTDHISGFQDIMPTLAEVANAEVPSITDGVSFLPTLLGQPEKQNTHEYLYWEETKNRDINKALYRAIRHGNWKAVQYGLKGKLQLFNLANDISEQHDIAKKHPEKVKYYKALFKKSSVPVTYFPYANTGD